MQLGVCVHKEYICSTNIDDQMQVFSEREAVEYNVAPPSPHVLSAGVCFRASILVERQRWDWR